MRICQWASVPRRRFAFTLIQFVRTFGIIELWMRTNRTCSANRIQRSTHWRTSLSSLQMLLHTGCIRNGRTSVPFICDTNNHPMQQTPLVKLATTKKKNNENIYDTFWSLFEWRRREKKSDCRKLKEKYKRTAQTWNSSFVWHFYLRFDGSIFISLSFSGARKKIRGRKILNIPIPLCVWCMRCLSVCLLYVANEE